MQFASEGDTLSTAESHLTSYTPLCSRRAVAVAVPTRSNFSHARFTLLRSKRLLLA